jgi:hypothetical protein
VFASAATAWEIATKFRIGKLPGVAAIVTDLAAVLEAQKRRVNVRYWRDALWAGVRPSTNPLRGRTHWRVEVRSRVTVRS